MDLCLDENIIQVNELEANRIHRGVASRTHKRLPVMSPSISVSALHKFLNTRRTEIKQRKFLFKDTERDLESDQKYRFVSQ